MNKIAQVALAVPLRKTFDYAISEKAAPGMRVSVPFGKTTRIGVITALKDSTSISKDKLKAVIRILDETPLIPKDLMSLLMWSAKYYHAPIGDVIFSALPAWCREGKSLAALLPENLHFTETGRALNLEAFTRAKRQQQLLRYLQKHPVNTFVQLEIAGFNRALIRIFIKNDWLHCQLSPLPTPSAQQTGGALTRQTPLSLNQEQTQALTRIIAATQESTPNPIMLEGITGSGKTEVYLQAIEYVLTQGKQALVLVPEIALTPQTIARFTQRFNVNIAAMHSGLTPKARAKAWFDAKCQVADIIIGTRSAVFTPLPKLGMIIIDESHDASFKQQEGQNRYSARDLAIVRAKLNACPIVLGSATPSSESLHNLTLGRYTHLTLNQRATGASPPRIELIDLKQEHAQHGCTPSLLNAMKMHLSQGGQVLLFVNRRGYAPTLLCHACGWMGTCKRCDIPLTYHLRTRALHCHHCESRQPVPISCPQCQTSQLTPLGIGTERLEEYIHNTLPEYNVIRVDSDNTKTKDALSEKLDSFREGRSHIAIGTQMLAKGHHFENLSLVGIIDIDSGLYSADFRASERMGQLITQVAGRAGREKRAGEVYIQTYKPDDVLLQTLLNGGYRAFMSRILKARQTATLPPFCAMGVLSASALSESAALDWLTSLKHAATQKNTAQVQILGPMPAMMARRRGLYRFQLWLKAPNKHHLWLFLSNLIKLLNQKQFAQPVKWHLDVDPIDMF